MGLPSYCSSRAVDETVLKSERSGLALLETIGTTTLRVEQVCK